MRGQRSYGTSTEAANGSGSHCDTSDTPGATWPVCGRSGWMPKGLPSGKQHTTNGFNANSHQPVSAHETQVGR
jgi:hypothetical protein